MQYETPIHVYCQSVRNSVATVVDLSKLLGRGKQNFGGKMVINDESNLS